MPEGKGSSPDNFWLNPGSIPESGIQPDIAVPVMK
jgi:hypothetical protein